MFEPRVMVSRPAFAITTAKYGRVTAREGKPSVRTRQDNGQNKAGGSNHHRNEVPFLTASLITGERILRTRNVKNLLFLGHGLRVVLTA